MAYPRWACPKVSSALSTIALTALVSAQALAVDSSATGCHPEWPVVAHRGGAEVEPPASAAVPIVCATETGYAASESTLAVTNTGAIFYSPAHTENSLARSVDGGATWNLTYPPEMQFTSLWNTVDPYVTVDRGTGRLFWVHATGDLRTAPVLVDESPLPWQVATAVAYAHGFQVYSSPDDGRTWTTADYQHEFLGDWEKIFVGPPPPGGAGPSAYPNVVYVCGNAPFEVSGPGRACYKSLDGGVTFALAGYVFPSPSAPVDFCPALAANVGVVASDGTTYQPQSCAHGAWLAVSRDEGASYGWLPVAGAPPSSGFSGSLQIAIDDADDLYALWVTDDRLELAISRDRGQSWSAPLPVGAPGVHVITHPAIAAGARGQVGLTYYGSRDASAQTLSAYITETWDALDPDPLFYSAAINDPAQPIYRDYGFDASPRTDFVGGSYDALGSFWAGVVEQLGPPDAEGNVPTTGYVGRLVWSSS